MLTGMSLVAAVIPLPIVPNRVLQHLRGALAYDVASRHSISLSTDARRALATPSSRDRMRAALRSGVELLAKRLLRRIGPLAPLSTAAATFEVYALGRLLERYFVNVRPKGTMRMHEAEALRVRRVIDESVLRTFYPSTAPRPLLLTETVEDLRDEFTRWVDTLLLTGATLPSYLERRLEAAFDDLVQRSPDLADG